MGTAALSSPHWLTGKGVGLVCSSGRSSTALVRAQRDIAQVGAHPMPPAFTLAHVPTQIAVPIEDVHRTHLRFTFRHRSSSDCECPSLQAFLLALPVPACHVPGPL